MFTSTRVRRLLVAVLCVSSMSLAFGNAKSATFGDAPPFSMAGNGGAVIGPHSGNTNPGPNCTHDCTNAQPERLG